MFFGSLMPISLVPDDFASFQMGSWRGSSAPKRLDERHSPSAKRGRREIRRPSSGVSVVGGRAGTGVGSVGRVHGFRRNAVKRKRIQYGRSFYSSFLPVGRSISCSARAMAALDLRSRAFWTR